ncbi:hypothetical protein AAG906_025530 [Vitis piasezkii]
MEGMNEEISKFSGGCSFIFRWDIKSINQLPEYMEVTYQALSDVGSLTKHNGSIEELHTSCTNPFTAASCLIARLMNDMTTHKFEQERGHVASAIECYVKQYSVSKQQAYDEFNKQIANAWNEINQGFLVPTSMPIPILIRVLNLTRVADIIYKENDEYTHVGKVMKDNIASLLIDLVPI